MRNPYSFRRPVSCFLFPVVLFILFMANGSEAAKAMAKEFDVHSAKQLVKAFNNLGSAGATINLAPGEYVIEQPLQIKNTSHINLVGSGWNTIIRKKGAGDALTLTNSHFCFIRNLMIAGVLTEATGSGIVYRDCSSCVIDYCRIDSFPTSGVRYEGNAKLPMSSNTLRNCHLISNMGDQLYSFHNNDFYICGNQFGNFGTFPRTGCVLDFSSAGTYTMNYHWGNLNALRMTSSNFNRIEDNRFENSRETGVIFGNPNGGGWCAFNIVTGNTIHTNSEDASGKFPAMEAYFSHQITFCQNQVFSWSSDVLKHRSSLIIGQGCLNWIVKDNNFRHNVEKSLVYDENAGHIVKDNLMD